MAPASSSSSTSSRTSSVIPNLDNAPLNFKSLRYTLLSLTFVLFSSSEFVAFASHRSFLISPGSSLSRTSSSFLITYFQSPYPPFVSYFINHFTFLSHLVTTNTDSGAKVPGIGSDAKRIADPPPPHHPSQGARRRTVHPPVAPPQAARLRPLLPVRRHTRRCV